ncbi:HAD family hydrolase [Phocaeicola sartorii]|uniref:HAD family hydrolase n=1 Tax=Phocaeicola sartorii TaxID=671267 RepID=UPI0032B26A33
MSNKIIFTDFFDTVMFRRIHSSQIYVQWAKALIHKYPVIGDNQTSSTLELLLHECRNKLRMQYKEPPYQLVIGLLYDKLIETTQLAVNKEQFIIQSLKIDIAVELGCQYPNEHLVKRFRKAKMDGAKIYIVSDFYLPQEAYNAFLMKSHLDDLFDGVYVSETFNCTKSDGSLYVYVLNDLHLDPEYVEMYGDNRHSDVKMAKINGIKGKWYFPLKHKVWTNISRKLNWDYSKRIVRKESWWLYRHTNFEEYSLVLYYFNQKLKQAHFYLFSTI